MGRKIAECKAVEEGEGKSLSVRGEGNGCGRACGERASQVA